MQFSQIFCRALSQDLHCYVPVPADREAGLFIEACDQLPVLVRPGISQGREFIAVRGGNLCYPLFPELVNDLVHTGCPVSLPSQ